MRANFLLEESLVFIRVATLKSEARVLQAPSKMELCRLPPYLRGKQDLTKQVAVIMGVGLISAAFAFCCETLLQ